jgi:hypothetical protein
VLNQCVVEGGDHQVLQRCAKILSKPAHLQPTRPIHTYVHQLRRVNDTYHLGGAFGWSVTQLPVCCSRLWSADGFPRHGADLR